ncbi:hypothetical protein Awo_c31690 [Acetobacterium woodii DSM 1030]|uniref:Uncharacterized protein n=1 Tax=Acetobacterium woodii (strain ATCC 29683 / DSM 1030 / JCM 2381 / KCTC 1655 / WB1) TaxID=931626 RepID=H6LJG9_ACEWD|nr:hypothetical protein Awo_c31690 [Acetobacterium woodii DSM 1030]
MSKNLILLPIFKINLIDDALVYPSKKIKSLVFNKKTKETQADEMFNLFTHHQSAYCLKYCYQINSTDGQ